MKRFWIQRVGYRGNLPWSFSPLAICCGERMTWRDYRALNGVILLIGLGWVVIRVRIWGKEVA